MRNVFHVFLPLLRILSYMEAPSTKNKISLAILVVALVLIGIPMILRSVRSTPATRVNVGKTFEVTLDAQPETGYRWDLLASDAKRVELVGHSDPAAIVASRREVWTFRAKAEGTISLFFGFVNPDYPNMVAYKTRAFIVIISP
jgi:predicted secreted protein